MPTFMYVNPVAPEALAVDVAAGTSGLDMTTVTAVSMKVTKPGAQAEVTWSASIESATTSTLRAKHTFVLGDVDVVGNYRVQVEMTVPGGSRRSTPRYFEAVK